MTAIAPAFRSSAETRPGFGRLTCVELRKMADTRAGFWVLLAVAVLDFVAVIATLLSGDTAARAFPNLLHSALEPSYFLLPVSGVLLVTSEFSQRTALTTFALIPSRSRVLRAKLAATLVFSAAGLAVALTASLLGAVIGNSPAGIPAAVIPQSFVYLSAAMLTGVAFGTVVLVSAPAIVALLLLPNAWSVLTNDIRRLHGLGDWLNPTTSLDPLSRHALSTTEWEQVITTLVVWLMLPLAVGTWRLVRRDLG